MKLIKLSSDHYIIVDESKQPVEGYYYDNFIKDIRDTRGAEYGQADHCWQITHSTQPLEYTNEDHLHWYKIEQLSLSEVKELLGEVDVEKKATGYANTFIGEESTADVDYKAGYIAALEDNKGKIYTEEDIIKVVRLSLEDAEKSVLWSKEYPQKLADKILQSLQSPTSWDIQFVNGKLKLV